MSTNLLIEPWSTSASTSTSFVLTSSLDDGSFGASDGGDGVTNSGSLTRAPSLEAAIWSTLIKYRLVLTYVIVFSGRASGDCWIPGDDDVDEREEAEDISSDVGRYRT